MDVFLYFLRTIGFLGGLALFVLGLIFLLKDVIISPLYRALFLIVAGTVIMLTSITASRLVW